jgi:peptidoglycan/LPS O-acetylase OafA/YrhL
MYVLLKKKSCKSINIPILKDLGKASYNVYLVQMTFYGCGPVLVIYKYVDNKLCQLMLCIIACLILGYLFYLIEKQLSKLLSLFVERKMYFKFEISSLIKRINSISTQ